MATLITSKGNSIIFSPFSENITKMVNNNAIGVSHAAYGINFV